MACVCVALLVRWVTCLAVRAAACLLKDRATHETHKGERTVQKKVLSLPSCSFLLADLPLASAVLGNGLGRAGIRLVFPFNLRFPFVVFFFFSRASGLSSFFFFIFLLLASFCNARPL